MNGSYEEEVEQAIHLLHQEARYIDPRLGVEDRRVSARNILAEHACETDYDGVCIGCVCTINRQTWRDCTVEESNHLEHADHLARLLYGA